MVERLTALYKPSNTKKHEAADYENLESQVVRSAALLIRHGASESNLANNEIVDKMPEEGLPMQDFLDVYFNLQFQDTLLSADGIDQCEVAGRSAQKVNFQTVFVSPLRRTMETAFHTFKDHANFKAGKMRFILHPMLRELFSMSCDVPLENAQLKAALESKYKPMFKGMLDTTLMEEIFEKSDEQGKPWFALHVEKAMAIEAGPAFVEKMNQQMSDLYPSKIEGFDEIKKRADAFKSDLEAYIKAEKENGVFYAKEADAPKVAVVGHSAHFRIYTSDPAYWRDVFHPVSHNKYPPSSQCRALLNCEIYPDLNLNIE